MIAVTFALKAESKDLIARLRGARIAKETKIIHTGVGRKACQRSLDKFFSRSQPDFLISSGFAGGVQEDIKSGDLILARNYSDPGLLALAQQILGRGAKTVKTMTIDSITDTVSERNRIAEAANAAAVDMETEFISLACAARDIPMLSVRVISDSVTELLPAPPAVLFDVATQKTSLTKMARYLLANPTAISRLTRFSKQIRTARQNLTEALLELLERI